MKALFLGWEFGDGLIASHETYMIWGSCGSKCPFHAHTPQFHSWLEKSLPRSLLRFRPLSTDGHVFFRRPVYVTCKSDDDDVQINITQHVPKAAVPAACGWKCDNFKPVR